MIIDRWRCEYTSSERYDHLFFWWSGREVIVACWRCYPNTEQGHEISVRWSVHRARFQSDTFWIRCHDTATVTSVHMLLCKPVVPLYCSKCIAANRQFPADERGVQKSNKRRSKTRVIRFTETCQLCVQFMFFVREYIKMELFWRTRLSHIEPLKAQEMAVVSGSPEYGQD